MFYNSSNIGDIEGKSFDLLVSAGTSALVWLANKEPEKDIEAINKLINSLQYVKAKKFILISTIHVYPNPIGVDEDSEIDIVHQQPYGKHRFLLENFVRKHFDATIVRLPHLFGEGIKKGVIYDLLNKNQVEKIDSGSIFQFYNLNYIWKDITIALNNNLKILNVATEPVSVKEIARCAFEMGFENRTIAQPVYCDFHTKYAKFWGKNGKYLYDKIEVLEDLKKFVDTYKNHKLKLAVSNIGWNSSEEEDIRKLLLEMKVKGIEVSPDRLFNKKLEFDENKIIQYRNFWMKSGIDLVSIQGILFSKDNLKIFKSEEDRSDTMAYLKKIISVAEKLGVRVIMFGSPKNRKRNELATEEADVIAVPFFRELARCAYDKGIYFCIEHNPKEYGSDYIETASEALILAKKVNHPGFGVNIDTGALLLSGDASEAIISCGNYIKHFHISQPYLSSVESIDENVHKHFASALRKIKY
ncbi:MAG: TIM barrel protein, partial [Nanoarchaeota archaeon]